MERALEIAESLLARPTAPFHEDEPVRFALDLAKATPGLSADVDAAGNVVVRTGGPGVPLVLVAHLDHPGFAVDLVIGATAELSFRGGLAEVAALVGSRVQFFRQGMSGPVGEGELVGTIGEADRLTAASAIILSGETRVGDFAMWAFPPFELEEGRITARACDDLVGAAAILSCLETAATGTSRPVWGLLTRAEEVGLLGAFEAIRLGTVPVDAVVLSLECSKALPEAPQGQGVIVRVGDRMSIFDPAVTAALTTVAAAANVPYTRRLMDGGVCEASAFCAAGYRASGLCIALGNYHNADDVGRGVGPEHVLADDYLAEVRLLDRLATTPLDLDPYGPWLAERTEKAQDALGAGGA